jgi:glycosyltransferase involved in cell wall biosynthesis
MNPGLSILIPVYNHGVEKLVRSLLAQSADWNGPLEIRLLDDGSAPAYRELNRPLGELAGVVYQELEANVGRAAIRNRLAAAAEHEWLLLLDNDSLLPDAHFLQRYAGACDLASVLIGGTAYQATPPADPALRLRWLYGQHREARPAAVRQRQPYAQLTVNNALVKASVMRRYPLDETLTTYGHEDTRLGVQLAAAHVPVLHLDNPVLHDGLEPAAAFLAKSEEAVCNLAKVYRQDGLGAESRLLQTALRLRNLGLSAPVGALLNAAEGPMRQNSLSPRPKLPFFDLLKLRWLLRELGTNPGSQAPAGPAVKPE